MIRKNPGEEKQNTLRQASGDNIAEQIESFAGFQTKRRNRMRSNSIRIVILFLSALLWGCASAQTPQTQAQAEMQQELRVGVTPDYAPLIFRQNNRTTGIEADLARRLAEDLKDQVHFVALPWDDLIPALMDGRIDIIMSGMGVTKARQVRIAFTEPYLKSGLIAAFRAEDANKYTSKDSILDGSVAVGAVRDTTADAFVKKNFPNAVRKTSFPVAEDGASELKRRAIDIFVDDAPFIIWTVSENEADIAALWEPLTEEYLAWGVRKGDEKFLAELNNILNRWKQDGTLHEILRKWLPEGYFKKINQ
jgi:polar amino acid transport system substrate-binding protein